MELEKFRPENYFDLSKFEFADIFIQDKPAWETIAKIKPYIEEKFAKGEVKKQIPEAEGSVFSGENIHIGEGTVILPGTFIMDNVIIGKNCKLGPNAYIRDNVIIGDGQIIGNCCEIKNSIVLGVDHPLKPGIPHFNYVGDSIIGKNCNIAAGTLVANIRFDFFTTEATINVRDGEEKVDSGLRKFGVIMGDGAQTGCNCVILPGTIVGKKAILGGSMNRKGVIPAEAKEY